MALFSKLTNGLKKTRALFSNALSSFTGGTLDEDALEDLEEALILADTGMDTVMKLTDRLRERNKKKDIPDGNAGKALEEEIAAILVPETQAPSLLAGSGSPYVIMLTGVNGAGKTTTAGKLARHFTNDGKKVVLAACDTFRSAAVEQLEAWAHRADAEIIKQQSGSDPAAVAYDALEAAKARNADVLIIDTAGRLHTKANLMEELKKIKRVLNRNDATLPHESIIVLDAGVGQNGLMQARAFNETIGLTGIILTKLDGTAKGGIVLTVCDTLNVPIRMIGIGEGIEDLREFNAVDYAAALIAP